MRLPLQQWWQQGQATARRRPWLVPALLATLLIFWPGLVTLLQLSWRERVIAKRLDALEQRRAALLEQKQRLESDPIYLENVIRSTLKVAKPGELVVPLASTPDSEQP